MPAQNIVGAAVPDEVYEFPCSFGQQRLWIDDRLTPGNPFYNIHASIRVPSVLDPAALKRALAALVARHESLRTSFGERDGQPLQRVASHGLCDFSSEDLRLLAPAPREARVLALAHAEATWRFNLEHGPLLRTRLLRTGDTESVLMLTIHHIVADAWSMGILLREITALYVEAAGGRAAALPELPIQYADYALWQHSEAAPAFDEQLAYWCRRLQGLSTLALPTARPRPPTASHCGHTLHFGLDQALSRELLGFAQAHSLTPYVASLAALAVVLQRNATQDEVVIGVPVAGRDRPELEGVIGFFVNTLVLRLDLAGDPSFAALAQRVQVTLHDALAHQSLPFERLVQELCPQRDLSRNPLFQVSAQFLAAPGVGAATQGAVASLLEIQRGAANFDLSFDFWRSGDRIEARVDYATDLFDASTIERWVAQWQRVLAQVLMTPERQIESIDLLSSAERELLLGPWAGQRVPYPRDSNLALQWAEVVQRRTGEPALRCCATTWSYAQLDHHAARYATMLAAAGVLARQHVGVALPRGAEQVSALIAILRLGASYVALDPAWPARRLALCIEAATLSLVLCAAADATTFAALGVKTLSPQALPSAPVAPLPQPVIAPLDPAYIAFTSGSTGVPKGVIVPHRAVLRLVCGNPQVPLSEHDTMLVYAPLAFDASTLELWGALINGACLSIPPAGPLGLDELARWIEAERITVAWLTAGLFHQLAASHPATLARIERLYAGGDVLGSAAVRQILLLGNNLNTVLNGYGPTENTTFTCVHAMRTADESAAPVPIGRPIANGHVRVIDARGRLTPVGIAGELFAGGDGVALGYLGDQALTAQRFVSDPFARDGDRLYRTGDRARWREDGVLEFLGRVDRQLKVRGYRIEPGEIENALRALPGVNDAHVMARNDHSGDKHLVAHIASDAETSPPELLRQLGASLPGWMLPSAVQVHRDLPLNANGKIDEAALDRAYEAELSETAAVSPVAALSGIQGEIEALVVQVWSEVLGRAVVEPLANFFTDLGGHSLLATQAVSRLNAALDIALPLAAIFEAPSARGVAGRIEALLLAELEEGR